MKPLIEQITDAMIVEHEDNIVRAVQNIGIYVDKERLAKALIDSRSFYDEGHADAKAKYGKAHGEWIDKGTWMVDRQGKFYIPQGCSVCGYKLYDSHTTNFCPNCGADMRVVE